MSAILDLINFVKVFAVPSVEDGGASGTSQIDPPDEKKKTASFRPGETTASDQEIASEEYGKKLDALTSILETKLTDAEEARDERKAKYQEDKTKQGWLGRNLSEDTKFLMDTGSEAAAKQRAEGTAASQSQGPVQSSPGGVGTGKATGINRAKIAQKPLGTAGKVPSMSTKVRMNKPPKMMATPQMPIGQKMEKDNSNVSKLLKALDYEKDKGMAGVQRVVPKQTEHEKRLQAQAWTESKSIAGQAKRQLRAEKEKKFNKDYMEKDIDDDGYNIKRRPQRNVQGQKDKGDMKITGKGVQNLQQIIVNRAKKLKEKE